MRKIILNWLEKNHFKRRLFYNARWIWSIHFVSFELPTVLINIYRMVLNTFSFVQINERERATDIIFNSMLFTYQNYVKRNTLRIKYWSLFLLHVWTDLFCKKTSNDLLGIFTGQPWNLLFLSRQFGRN